MIVWSRKKGKQPFKEDKTLPASLTNADNKEKDLHLCHWACVRVPLCSGGNFNPSVVTSLLWSCLCGVAICSLAQSRARHYSLFLSPTVPRSTCTLNIFLCFFFSPFWSKFSLLHMSFHLRLSGKRSEGTLERTETHKWTRRALDQRRGGSCNRDQIILVAWSMKLASSMDVTG